MAPPAPDCGTEKPPMPCGPRQRDVDTATEQGSLPAAAIAEGALIRPSAMPAAAANGTANRVNDMMDLSFQGCQPHPRGGWIEGAAAIEFVCRV